MIGKIVKSEDFQKKLIISSHKKKYNSNSKEINIKNKNLEFGDIFSDLDTISKYRTGTINYICFSGKENVDENGTVINLTFPENLKEINSIKLIVSLNDFEVYTSEISDSVFTKLEIQKNTQEDVLLLEQNVDDGDYGIYSSGMYFLNEKQDENNIKNYKYRNQVKITTTKTKSTGNLLTPFSFREIEISNIIWYNPDYIYSVASKSNKKLNLIGHTHQFTYLANLLGGYDHVHTLISNDHSHEFNIPYHLHYVDQNHQHRIIFKTHYHEVLTSHNHNINGENLFFKNFSADKIKIKEINKTFSINGNTEIDLSNHKLNFLNQITLLPNAKCNLIYFLYLELYCLDE